MSKSKGLLFGQGDVHICKRDSDGRITHRLATQDASSLTTGRKRPDNLSPYAIEGSKDEPN
jgi:hypothetical protein